MSSLSTHCLGQEYYRGNNCISGVSRIYLWYLLLQGILPLLLVIRSLWKRPERTHLHGCDPTLELLLYINKQKEPPSELKWFDQNKRETGIGTKMLPMKITVGNHFCNVPATSFRVLQLQEQKVHSLMTCLKIWIANKYFILNKCTNHV